MNKTILDLLMYKQSEVTNHFMENIRLYNSLMAFTSCNAKLDKDLIQRQNNGIYCYRINGQIHHLISNHMNSNESNYKPKFSQFYIYDAQFEKKYRNGIYSNLNQKIIDSIQAVLNEMNPYVQTYTQAGYLLRDNQHNFCIQLKKYEPNDKKNKTYHNPTSSDEIAVIMPTSNLNSNHQRDIIIHVKNPNPFTNPNGLERISENSSHYDPLHYVLMFLNGRPGWQYQTYRLKQINRKTSWVSPMQFYSYHIQDRQGINYY